LPIELVKWGYSQVAKPMALDTCNIEQLFSQWSQLEPWLFSIKCTFTVHLQLLSFNPSMTCFL